MKDNLKSPLSFPFYKHLLDYVYQQMPSNEEKALEDFLNQHQAYAQTMDHFLKHCIQKRFSRSQLTHAIEQDLNFYQKQFPLFFSSAFTTLATSISIDSFNSFLKNLWSNLQQWFQPNPPLVFSSNLMSSPQLTVLSPTPETVVEKKVKFQLLFPNITSLNLQIFDTQNTNPIFQKKINPNSQNFSINTNTKEFHPGIFYWILGNMKIGQQQGTFIVSPIFNPVSSI